MNKATNKYLLDIISSGLEGELNRFELASLSLARSIKKENPEVSEAIYQLINKFALGGIDSIRKGRPMPKDDESHLDIAFTYSPDSTTFLPPIFNSDINNKVNDFFEERHSINELLKEDVKPSSSLLLLGPPGTGKTMLAKYIASYLDLELIVLDLSASLSRYMGKTGLNLKRVLKYAKSNPCVLLFDEFDAIAKRRNDDTDLGEIKRVVNVLLMELEDWPSFSILIATSNHPELLDKAVWRRFDQIYNIPLPSKEIRAKIILNQLEGFIPETKSSLIEATSVFLKDYSPAEIYRFTDNIKRKSIIKKTDPIEILLKECSDKIDNKKDRARICLLLKEQLKDNISIREIARITGLSPAGVQHHLSKSAK